MLVKGIMTQISGSIGGVTGSHNRGGMYLRARTIPVDPASLRQQTMRNAIATLTARWRDVLTQAQRDAWAVYAANTPLTSPLGDVRDVGALPMYIRGNAPRLQGNHPIVDDPAVSGLPVLNAPTSITLTAATGVLVVNLADDPWTSTDGAFLSVFASRQLSEAINFWKGPYRLIGTLEGDSVTPVTAFTGSYSDVWGEIAAGTPVRLQLRVSDEFAGLSAPIRTPVTAT